MGQRREAAYINDTHLFHHCTLIFFCIHLLYSLFLSPTASHWPFFAASRHASTVTQLISPCISLWSQNSLGREKGFFFAVSVFSTLLTYIYTRNSEHGWWERGNTAEEGNWRFMGVVNGAFFVTLACWIWDEVLVDHKMEIMHAYVYMN